MLLGNTFSLTYIANEGFFRSNSLGQKTVDSFEDATFSDTYNHISDSFNYGRFLVRLLGNTKSVAR